MHNICVVDDDESVRTAMGRLVRSLGYHSLEFPSAEAFLASSSLGETACLIADVQMPGGMSGLDLQDALRAQGNLLPIILITAFPTDAIRTRAQAAGASGFFGKPVDIQKLILCVDAVLNEPRS